MTTKQKTQRTRIALGLSGLGINDTTAEIIWRTVEKLNEMGGNFDLKTASKIQALVLDKTETPIKNKEEEKTATTPIKTTAEKVKKETKQLPIKKKQAVRQAITEKTAKEWFKQLKEPYRTQATRNINLTQTSSTFPTLSFAIMGALNWSDSKQGFDYWNNIHLNLSKYTKKQNTTKTK